MSTEIVTISLSDWNDLRNPNAKNPTAVADFHNLANSDLLIVEDNGKKFKPRKVAKEWELVPI